MNLCCIALVVVCCIQASESETTTGSAEGSGTNSPTDESVTNRMTRPAEGSGMNSTTDESVTNRMTRPAEGSGTNSPTDESVTNRMTRSPEGSGTNSPTNESVTNTMTRSPEGSGMYSPTDESVTSGTNSPTDRSFTIRFRESTSFQSTRDPATGYPDNPTTTTMTIEESSAYTATENTRFSFATRPETTTNTTTDPPVPVCPVLNSNCASVRYSTWLCDHIRWKITLMVDWQPAFESWWNENQSGSLPFPACNHLDVSCKHPDEWDVVFVGNGCFIPFCKDGYYETGVNTATQWKADYEEWRQIFNRWRQALRSEM
ncbi:uncharacterized protein LOC143464953 isoform X6 [Clavelina lepadiformis]|uniref:uncharacterized protein LOC143464953 isoform X6 n=1 Tax=Clavelina lepadiformis TaxID=159417 RepID=UPI004040EAAD